MPTRALLCLGLTPAGLALVGCADPTASLPYGRSSQPEWVVGELRRDVAIQLQAKARLLEDGSVRVTLRALCPPGFQVIEGPVSVIQGPEFQEVFGEGFFTIPCNGHWKVERVRVIAPEGLQRGFAEVTASLMVEHPSTGEFLQGDDHRALIIH